MPFVHARKDKLPSLKCPSCGGLAVYSKTKVIRPLYHHYYKCLRCKAKIASPTEYGFCEKYDIIVKDTAANDCFMCPVPKQLGFDVKNQKCPFWKGSVPYPEVEAKIEKEISRNVLQAIGEKDETQYERSRSAIHLPKVMRAKCRMGCLPDREGMICMVCNNPLLTREG